MAKGMIVYVTRTGNCRKLAEQTAKETGFPVHEIQDLVNRKGLFGWLKAGFQASTGVASPIKEAELNLAGLDTIILVYPVWASSVCPPVRTWLRLHQKELQDKRIGLIASNLGSPGDRVRAAFEREFYPLQAFTVIQEREPEGEKLQKIRTFTETLLKK
jgi:flavodoxin